MHDAEAHEHKSLSVYRMAILFVGSKETCKNPCLNYKIRRFVFYPNSPQMSCDNQSASLLLVLLFCLYVNLFKDRFFVYALSVYFRKASAKV